MAEITAEELRKFGPVFEPRPYFDNEGDSNFQVSDLNAGYVPDGPFYCGKSVLTNGCVDGFFSVLNDYEERGILLITRKRDPAKDYLWSIGGTIPRGKINLREALGDISKRECGLELDDFVYIGSNSLGWATTPKMGEYEGRYVGGKGARDIIHVYYAQGSGEMRFGELDNDPIIVTPKMWRKREGKLKNLHPYVEKNLERAIALIE